MFTYHKKNNNNLHLLLKLLKGRFTRFSLSIVSLAQHIGACLHATINRVDFSKGKREMKIDLNRAKNLACNQSTDYCVDRTEQ